MHTAQHTDIKIVIFAKSHKDRDQLRNHLAVRDATFLYFEKEAICFDNLGSIQPDIVVARTDSKEIVRRFVFAAYTLKFPINLLVISDVLESEPFEFADPSSGACSIRKHRFSDELNKIIQQLVSAKDDHCRYEDGPLLIGESAEIKRIRSIIPNLKKAGDPILISGESGTGKKLVANLLAGSVNPKEMMFQLDCADLSQDDGMGAFNFEISQNGNGHSSVAILIDGIDKAGSRLQSEILTLLDKNGKAHVQKDNDGVFNLRLIATSDSELEYSIKQGKFRQDLFFRLNVIPLEIPPLRKRKEDIAPLADFFMLQARRQLNKSFIILSSEIKQQLYLHDWPGNVDELRKVIRHIAVTGDEASVLKDDFLPKPQYTSTDYFKHIYQYAVLPDVNEIKNELNNSNQLPLKVICDKYISRIEKKIMQRALESTSWNRKKAAALLNISYKSMLNKMKIYEII